MKAYMSAGAQVWAADDAAHSYDWREYFWHRAGTKQATAQTACRMHKHIQEANHSLITVTQNPDVCRRKTGPFDRGVPPEDARRRCLPAREPSSAMQSKCSSLFYNKFK